MIDDQDETTMDKKSFDNLMKSRMSSKTRLIDDHIPLDDKKARNFSPLANDFIQKQKLLALLVITIRLFNFNIHLSDLLRWCIDGNLIYHDLSIIFDQKQKIFWNEIVTFRNYRYPNYDCILTIIRNMIVHCNIDLKLFPVPDIYNLIERFLYDLNLPKGLILIIKKRYQKFLDRYTGENTLLFRMRKFTEYEIVSMIAIFSVLNDLFDLNGTTEQNYRLFRNRNSAETKKNLLFIWDEWLHYSKIRLNLIKMFRLNILPIHIDTINLDEILIQNGKMSDIFKNTDIVSNTKKRFHVFKNRLSLIEMFEQLHFSDGNFEWKERINEKETKPTLYPMTDATDEIINSIENSNLKQFLARDFRKELITPYCCDELNGFHRPHKLFKPTRHKDKYQYPESLQHLLCVASFITCSDMKYSLRLFLDAEQFSSKL
ncbi:paired box protein [Sarcoptes scabiei]|nr:paired box protein [Sarcoptes scabiei]